MQRGRTFKVAWLPERFANKGKILNINNVPGWKVIEVYATEDEDVVKWYSRSHQRWAKGRGLA
jgi:hypothetical protein